MATTKMSADRGNAAVAAADDNKNDNNDGDDDDDDDYDNDDDDKDEDEGDTSAGKDNAATTRGRTKVMMCRQRHK